MTGTPWMPRVAVDARMLHATGIGRYLRELLAAWRSADSCAELTLFGDPDELREFVAAHPSDTPTYVVAHRGPPYSVRAQRSWLTVARAAAACDVVFFPHWDAPVLAFPARGVVTVHDLTPFRTPGASRRGKRTVGRVVFERVLARASAVVCVSQAAAGDVLAEYPALGTRLHVVPNGVTAAFRGDATGAEPPAVAGPYLLWVGMLKPHKNPGAALDVLARVRAAGQADVRLVVVGRSYPELSFADLARARGVADAVVVLGEVTDAVLHSLYAHAGALLFPSRAEGFGLPVLEAMAAGAPVVASRIAPVEEVASGAAALFAPDDVAGMSDAVLGFLVDPVARAAAIGRGRARAAAYSWDASARATGAVLAAVARRAPAALDTARVAPRPEMHT